MADISKIKLPDDSEYTIKSSKIPFGTVDSTSTSTAYTATVPGITELKDGVCVMLKNGVVTSAAGFTININSLGGKPVYNNMAAATADTTIFNVNYTMLFVYDEERVSGGCWICYRGYNSDNNTIGYQLRTNATVMPTVTRTRYYRLLFTSADDKKWVPANTGYDNSATSKKTVNQNAIDPFGRIVYMSGTTNVNANANVGATVVWEQYTLNLGYSFNTTGSELVLTYPAPVYVKCAPESNGSAIIDSTTPYVQELPSTNDGKIYIYLGMAYSATNIELVPVHPVYYYKDSAIRLWSNADIPTKVSELTNDSGFITSYTETDPTVPSWAKDSSKPSYTFSEIGSKPTTLSGYGITDAKIASGTITLGNNTITPLTSYTETDPVFTASAAYGISTSDITAWNGAVTTANTALSGVNGTLIYDHTYTISNGVATFTPHVYLKGAEVTTDYAASCFVWKYRLIDGSEVTLTTKSDRGCDVTITALGYGGNVIGLFTPE